MKIQSESFPERPGCYLMKDCDGLVLYIGKAKNLRNRIKQYFSCKGDSRPQIPYLLEKVATIETIVVQSEKEALLLEQTLIQKHKPPYNILLKDDKSRLLIHLSEHAFPQISFVRGKEKKKKGRYFGPFMHGVDAKRVLEQVVSLFPLRQCSTKEFQRRERPCLLYEMKKCPGPCVGLCSKEEYAKNIEGAEKVLEGKTKEVLNILKKEMEKAAEALLFEKAHRIKKRIDLLSKVDLRQNVLSVGVGSLDVLSLYRKESDLIFAKLIFRNGNLIGAGTFSCSDVLASNEEAIEAFLLQHYKTHEKPREIYLPFSFDSLSHVEEFLEGPRLFVPQKGKKKELVQLAFLNAQNGWKRSPEKLLEAIQRGFSLKRFPSVIECYDQSHTSGDAMVSSRVVFIDGKPAKKYYRHYAIKDAAFSDDYGALEETLRRRFQKKEQLLPDLILIDGGRGHFQTALRVIEEEEEALCSDLLSLSKEEGRHDKGLRTEIVHSMHGQKELSSTSELLFFLQRIRDEAHRFAISFHRKKRAAGLKKSILDEIPGIGSQKKKALLKHFKSASNIQKASIEELLSVPGINKKIAEQIKKFFATSLPL